eukprot:CAMPEP_0181074786 /NCGR_PEP_ID=MMETSP1070-20121207/29776_1 /TAXON_ID=265543 /ORGANISM="Minutocellus polymorphus, Strain NH13" /LENGTH=284 /DNA_ID=CAMNT_0023155903 /DNA_START=11 /DNA_END=865 /DNA_ORIENTATION=+
MPLPRISLFGACCLLLVGTVAPSADAFQHVPSSSAIPTSRPITRLHSDAADDYAPSDCDDHSETLSATPTPPEAEALKSQLLNLCASYDRGYGSTPSARRRVDDIVAELTDLNPIMDGARGIDGTATGDVPLEGIWRMVWTTAVDVLNLGANPVLAPAAIYQKIDPPMAVNIIDLVPRIQSLLPGLPPNVLRAEVTTTAYSRVNMPGRVGLVFNSVKLQPVEVMGMEADALPPVGINFPKIPGADGSSGPGYFDILYLDADTLIYKQNDPGGYFVLTKVDDCDP